MLRWVFLLLLLANALVFFWYAQQHRAQVQYQAPSQPPELELLHELPAGGRQSDAG